jgi:hypothetical protein
VSPFIPTCSRSTLLNCKQRLCVSFNALFKLRAQAAAQQLLHSHAYVPVSRAFGIVNLKFFIYFSEIVALPGCPSQSSCCSQDTMTLHTCLPGLGGTLASGIVENTHISIRISTASLGPMGDRFLHLLRTYWQMHPNRRLSILTL